MKKIAILASGNGSNALKLIQRAQRLSHLTICLVITNKENAGVLDFAKRYEIPFKIIVSKGLTKPEHEQKLLAELKKHGVDWVFLAGYMRVLSSKFLKHFYDYKIKLNRVVNIHPSLLPAYKGLNAFERAFNAKDPESGITIHFVNDGVDEGKIIKQASFKRKPNDTIQDFTLRGQTLEHIIYPEFLSNLNTSFIMNTHPLTYEENNEI